MSSFSLDIRGAGMAASLGVSVVHAAAAARAGLSRPTPLEIMSPDPETGLGEPVLGHVVRDVTNGFAGIGRLWRLADRACTDLLRDSGLTARDGAKTCLWLHVRDDTYAVAAAAADPARPLEELRQNQPEGLAAERARFEEGARSVLLRGLGARLGIPVAQQFVSFGGAAEWMDAVSRAAAEMRARELPRCIVAAVDSLADPGLLRSLARLGLLKSSETPGGLSPGEAASFLAFEEPGSRATGALTQVQLSAVAHRPEPEHHRFAKLPPRGLSIAASLARTLGRPGERPAPRVAVGNFNGDPHGAAQWGDALVRLKARGWPVDYETWFPAIHFGDTGAAAAGVGVCLAARAFARGYNRGSGILVWGVSPSGAAGSCRVGQDEEAAA